MSLSDPLVRVPSSWGPEPAPPPGRAWPELMDAALAQAVRAARTGEIPVGAVVVDGDGHTLAAAHNETETLRDPTAHAEVLALRRAAATAGNHRLEGCVLVVTLEPCLMCAGAIREARIGGVVWGAADSRAGAIVSRLDGLDYGLDGGAPWHYGGVRAEECARLLRDFFQARRPDPKEESRNLPPAGPRRAKGGCGRPGGRGTPPDMDRKLLQELWSDVQYR